MRTPQFFWGVLTFCTLTHYFAEQRSIVGGMADELVIIPGNGTEGYVELSRSKQGRIFEKHILNYGELLYPGVNGGKVTIDDSFADKLITNFSNKVCDIVQVPKADASNNHSEDPDRNVGEVIGLAKRDGKIYAHIDARDEKDADKLGKTLIGASAMMHMDYTDTRTGTKVGPTLLHVAVTNRPYVVDLEEYKEIGEVIAASADGKSGAVVLTSPPEPKENQKMSTREELISELRADHNIDVAALQEQAAKAVSSVALSNQITEALADKGILKLSNGDTATADEVIGAFAELTEKNVELSNRIDAIALSSAETLAKARVSELVKSGHILPKEEEARVKLLLSNAELFDQLIPEKPLVQLSQPSVEDEKGFDFGDGTNETTLTDEIARLTNQVSSINPAIVKS